MIPSVLGLQGTSAANSGISDGGLNGEGGASTVLGGNVDGFTSQGGVLAVEMVNLDAKATSTGVLVTWETGLEIDNAGFNVYSQPGVGGGFTKLNPILIGAAGTAASYSFMDSKVLGSGESRLYFVEDVDVSGLATTLHGPAVVTGGVSSSVSGWDLY